MTHDPDNGHHDLLHSMQNYQESSRQNDYLRRECGQGSSLGLPRPTWTPLWGSGCAFCAWKRA
ncbi:hypothetical protein DFAR_490014 [Desulfarculales bacterium]